MSLDDKINHVRNNIEKYLELILLKISPSNKELQDAMYYASLKAGKRIRPFLVWAVADMLKADEKAAFYIGTAVELIHNYSLVHDDLPAMDNDIIRRGKPTVHKKFGEATAILVGDALLTEAFFILSANTFLISDTIKLEILHAVAEYSGARGMIFGQMLDIIENKSLRTLTLEDIKKIHQYKTASLITLACVVGARLANTPINIVEKIHEYGYNLGMAFQIMDDINDYNKKREDRINIVSFLGQSPALELAATYINNAQTSIKELPNNQNLSDLAQFILSM